MTIRSVYYLQYPVIYLNRLQMILPAARWELYLKTARAVLSPLRAWPTARSFGTS
jgi:hypothetical protein